MLRIRYSLTTLLCVVTLCSIALGAFYGGVGVIIATPMLAVGGLVVWTSLTVRTQHWQFGVVVGLLYIGLSLVFLSAGVIIGETSN